MALRNSAANYDYTNSISYSVDSGSVSTTSGSFTSLGGPTASIVVPKSGKVLVELYAIIGQTTQGNSGRSAVEYSGAYVSSASDSYAINYNSSGTSPGNGNTACLTKRVITGLTPGETLTGEMKYARVSSGTGHFKQRIIVMRALPE
tara:strand:+ start:136 stop:576 length:441 start_codon:yes stop_codon:yes gene_type:complete